MTGPIALDRGTVPLTRLIEVVGPLAVLGDPTGVAISAVTFDHRDVVPGALHCCVRGRRADGHDFAGRARAAGAVAFICERSLPAVGSAVQLVVAPGAARAAMARAASAFYGDPAQALLTIGVTGTNGKTTTTHLVAAILGANDWPTGVIGTLDGARTTPESPELQRHIARARDRGERAVALEVSSHALAQHRVDGIRFDVAVFTNLSQDHLDFHETMEGYFVAKAELFAPERARHAVVNADDPYGRRLLERPDVPTDAYRLADAKELRLGVARSTFVLWGEAVELHLGGRFNVANALAAATAARALGVAPGVIASGLGEARPVAGRFEPVARAGGVTVIVDYAHTPAALEAVLKAARGALGASGGGRAIVVFGCGGDRDRGKRPAMGAVASRLADIALITSDNPRSEDPGTIMEEVRAGCDGPGVAILEPDRRAAISRALDLARPGDIVLLAGKGHERVQQVGDRSLPFDDREVVLELIGADDESPRGPAAP